MLLPTQVQCLQTQWKARKPGYRSSERNSRVEKVGFVGNPIFNLTLGISFCNAEITCNAVALQTTSGGAGTGNSCSPVGQNLIQRDGAARLIAQDMLAPTQPYVGLMANSGMDSNRGGSLQVRFFLRTLGDDGAIGCLPTASTALDPRLGATQPIFPLQMFRPPGVYPGAIPLPPPPRGLAMPRGGPGA